ncbi:MAG: GNAT family N-acetyltransferase [Bacteroidia bacterium]|nr:GNAT family N-acetyltransferase [Bacteroidia bacterium]
MSIIENEKIILREFCLEDAESMYLLNNDPEVLKHTGDLPFKSLTEAKEFLLNYNAYQSSGMGRWAVIRRSDKAFVGWCGLKKHKSGMVDLGYRLMRSYWGNGYATMASQLSLEYAFSSLKLEEVLARAHIDNIASHRVAEKSGFSFWKETEVEGLGKAKIYKIKSEDWHKKRGLS